MAQIDSMLLEIENNTNNANAVKEMVLSRLLTDKIITEAQATEYAEKWQVIVFKKNWFERWMNSFSIENGDRYQFKFVKFED